MALGNKPGFMESFTRKLNEIKKTIEEDRYRRRVLVLCQQTEPRSFEEYSSSGSFRRLEKFESSTYSEVLKAIDMSDNNRPVVMKIMRALSKGVIKKMPSAATRGCQAYNDILNELIITQALSQLHDGVMVEGRAELLYRTHFFCYIHEIKVVNGNLERTLSKSQSSTPLNKTQVNQDEKAQVAADDKAKAEAKDDELLNLSEDDRMLMESLPFEYVVSVMRHDGQPLWWMMTHKKLSAEQLTSVLVQVIVGLAIAEKVYLYEHRDLHVSNILIKKTSKEMIPFILEGNPYTIVSHGIKATIIDATFSRLTHNGKVYFRDLTSTLKSYGTKKTPTRMSLQNRSYRQMVHITKNHWDEFKPKTNLIWLTYLCETLMKNDALKNSSFHNEIKKIRDYTLKVSTTMELLGYFPFDKIQKKPPTVKVSKPTTATGPNSTHSAPIGKDVTVVKDHKLSKTVTKDLSGVKAYANNQTAIQGIVSQPSSTMSTLNPSVLSQLSLTSGLSSLVSMESYHSNIQSKDKRHKNEHKGNTDHKSKK